MFDITPPHTRLDKLATPIPSLYPVSTVECDPDVARGQRHRTFTGSPARGFVDGRIE